MPQSVYAEDISVIIWVDDGNIFDRENYELAVQKFKDRGLKNIRTLYFKKETSIIGNLNQRINAFIEVDDKITNLVLASHGRTKLGKNQTSLSVLGGFGEKGPYKELDYILETLRPYFTSSLHIYLESCKTMCGTRAEIFSRSKGLYEALREYGVQELSIWGATETLYSHRRNHIYETNNYDFEEGKSGEGLLVRMNLRRIRYDPAHRFDIEAVTGQNVSCQQLFL